MILIVKFLNIFFIPTVSVPDKSQDHNFHFNIEICKIILLDQPHNLACLEMHFLKKKNLFFPLALKNVHFRCPSHSTYQAKGSGLN